MLKKTSVFRICDFCLYGLDLIFHLTQKTNVLGK